MFDFWGMLISRSAASRMFQGVFPASYAALMALMALTAIKFVLPPSKIVFLFNWTQRGNMRFVCLLACRTPSNWLHTQRDKGGKVKISLQGSFFGKFLELRILGVKESRAVAPSRTPGISHRWKVGQSNTGVSWNENMS